jgi:hypothetical protein
MTNEEEKKQNQDPQDPEETSQSRGDPGRSDRGPTIPAPEIAENPAKVDRGPNSDESNEQDA